jgi:crotonobetainyl-CoA hydratase
LGMMADSGGVFRLPRRLPRAIATELLFTGRRMGSVEALRWGLVNQVVAPDALLPAALALAQQVARSAPLALGALKQVLRATESQAVQDAYAMVRAGALPLYTAMLNSADAREGPLAFTEKRPPVWRAC